MPSRRAAQSTMDKSNLPCTQLKNKKKNNKNKKRGIRGAEFEITISNESQTPTGLGSRRCSYTIKVSLLNLSSMEGGISESPSPEIQCDSRPSLPTLQLLNERVTVTFALLPCDIPSRLFFLSTPHHIKLKFCIRG